MPPAASSTSIPNPIELRVVANDCRTARSRLIAGMLGVFFGALGAHRFYLGYRKLGAAQVAVTVLTAGVGGLWGILEGWLILCGRPGFDAAGHRLCHQSASHVSAALGVAVSVHAAGLAAYFLGVHAIGRVLPPPRGTNSISISASIESIESARAPTVELSRAKANPNDDGQRLPAALATVEKQQLASSTVAKRVAGVAMELASADPPGPLPLPHLSRPSRDEQPPATDHRPSITRKQAHSFPKTEKRATPLPADAKSDKAADSLVRAVKPRRLAPHRQPPSSITVPVLSKLERDRTLSRERLSALKQIVRAQSQPVMLNPSAAHQRRPEKSKPVMEQPAAEVSATAAAASASSREQHGAKTKSVPTKAYSPNPTYPPELLSKRIEGLVKLRVRVGKDGRVKQASVYRSSGRQQFDRAAMAVIYQWRFEPARRWGFPIESVIAVPVRFFIEQEQSRPE